MISEQGKYRVIHNLLFSCNQCPVNNHDRVTPVLHHFGRGSILHDLGQTFFLFFQCILIATLFSWLGFYYWYIRDVFPLASACPLKFSNTFSAFLTKPFQSLMYTKINSSGVSCMLRNCVQNSNQCVSFCKVVFPFVYNFHITILIFGGLVKIWMLRSVE